MEPFRQRAAGTALVILATLLSAAPAAVRAQSVHGAVVDGAQRPLSGVVLQLLDSTSGVVARALSNEGGLYSVAAPRGGTYRIRTLRIGFRSTTTEPFIIPPHASIARHVSLGGLGIALDTMRVVARNSCKLATDSSAATFAVWEQVRTALTAADITAREKIAGTTFSFERTLDADTRRMLTQRTAISSTYINEPWLSLSPPALHKVGYVTVDTTNATTYNAPGIEVLLSPTFVEDHCFHLTRADSRIGVEFEPAPERQRNAEIRGTLWLDRASSELRSLEYAYVHISPEQEAHARGEMSFVRMRDGTWAISHWTITMPVVEMKVIGGKVERTPVGAKPELKVYELIVRGGELVLARRGSDTIWAQPPRVLSGVVTDSSSARPIAFARVGLDGTPFEAGTDSAGRFTIEGLLVGNYTIEVHTPSLDSVSAVHQTPLAFTQDASVELKVPTGKQVSNALCGPAAREFPGIVIGTVSIKDDASMPRGMPIGIEWTTSASLGEAGSLRIFETKTDDHGAFRFCGVPVDADLTLRTLSDTGSARPVTLRIPPGSRFARALLEHDYEARSGAAFVGVVVADSSQQPIGGAQVAFPKLGRATVSGQNGVFRINDIPAGSHTIQVRRVGYAPLESTISFFANQTVDRRVVLSKAVVLEAMAVTETQLPPSFEENRRLGMGSFVTSEELEKKRGLTMESVLGDVKQMHLQRTNGGHTYLVAPRPPHSGCVNEACLREERLYYVPDNNEKNRGITTSCYVQVYMDRMLMNPGRPTPPFDIGSIATDQLAGIEFYPTRLQTPLKYNLSVGCGVLQLWSRRYID